MHVSAYYSATGWNSTMMVNGFSWVLYVVVAIIMIYRPTLTICIIYVGRKASDMLINVGVYWRISQRSWTGVEMTVTWFLLEFINNSLLYKIKIPEMIT